MDSPTSISSSIGGSNSTLNTTTEFNEDELLAGTDDEGSLGDFDEEKLLNEDSEEEAIIESSSSAEDDNSKSNIVEESQAHQYQTAVGDSFIVPATQFQDFTSNVIPGSQSFVGDSSNEESIEGEIGQSENMSVIREYQQQQLRLSVAGNASAVEEEEEFDNFEDFLKKQGNICSSTPFVRNTVRGTDTEEEDTASVGARSVAFRPSYDGTGNGTRRSTMSIPDSVYETANSRDALMMDVDEEAEAVPERIKEDVRQAPKAHPENPWEDGEVLKHVLSFIKGGTLLQLRKVNSKWNQLVKEILLEQNKICLRFQGDIPNDSAAGAPPRAAGQVYPQKALENLNSVLATAKDFPVRRIWLCGVNLVDTEVQRFFKLHGQRITHLCIWFRPGTPKLAFYALLKDRLKNIVALQLLNLPTSWGNDANTVVLRGLKLPYLKSLRFDDACQGSNAVGARDIIAAIIFGASKLEQLLNYPVYLNSTVSELERTHLIKSLSFEPDPENGRNVESYATLLNFRHKLESIKIMDLERHLASTNTWTAKYTEILHFILYRNRKHLVSLYTQPLGSIPNFVLKGCYPEMAKISFHCFSETISKKSKNCYTFLPADPEMNASKFPAMKSLEIMHLNCKNFPVEFAPDAFIENLFPGVTELLLDFATTGSGTVSEWIRFGNIMPNVKKLTLKVGLSSLAGILDRIWRVWQVETIVLYIKEDGFQYDHPFLDAVITGLTESQCKKLRGGVRLPNKALNSMRQSSSVMNCKNLKQFDWVFETEAGFKKHIQTLPKIVTEVAFTHGFCSKEIPATGKYLCQRR